MSWRIAESLEQLRRQLNAAFPRRSKVSDGGIGDAAHASSNSDHNPHIKDKKGVGVVTARDFTHDPANGLDCHWLARQLVKSRDPRIKYVIWNRQICSSKMQPWKWRQYKGKNPHIKHLHISIDADPKLYDNTAPWDLDIAKTEPVKNVFKNLREEEVNLEIPVIKPVEKTVDRVQENIETAAKETVDSTISQTQETVKKTIDQGNKKIETATTEIKNTFEPKNIPAFIPRLGKQVFWGLVPAGGFLSTVIAYIQEAPQWLIFLFGFITGITAYGFFQLLIKHRETVGHFITSCYRTTADPNQHNLIPTNAGEALGKTVLGILTGSRQEELERVLSPVVAADNEHTQEEN